MLCDNIITVFQKKHSYPGIFYNIMSPLSL